MDKHCLCHYYSIWQSCIMALWCFWPLTPPQMSLSRKKWQHRLLIERNDFWRNKTKEHVLLYTQNITEILQQGYRYNIVRTLYKSASHSNILHMPFNEIHIKQSPSDTKQHSEHTTHQWPSNCEQHRTNYISVHLHEHLRNKSRWRSTFCSFLSKWSYRNHNIIVHVNFKNTTRYGYIREDAIWL